MNPPLKLLQKIATAFDFNEDTLSRVRHVAVEFQFGRQTVNKRTKTDSLHGTAQDHLQSFALWQGQSLPTVRCGARGERALPICCRALTIVSICLTKKFVHESDLIDEKKSKAETHHTGSCA